MLVRVRKVFSRASTSSIVLKAGGMCATSSPAAAPASPDTSIDVIELREGSAAAAAAAAGPSGSPVRARFASAKEGRTRTPVSQHRGAGRQAGADAGAGAGFAACVWCDRARALTARLHRVEYCGHP
eukprot:SAG22_NODE_7044_length_782_cov_1.468521_2_plen_126_part_01